MKLTFAPEKTNILYYDMLKNCSKDQVLDIIERHNDTANRECTYTQKGCKRQREEPFTVNINGHSIQESEYVRVLGVYLNNKLTWRDHLKIALDKANRKWNMLSSSINNKWGVDPRTAIIVYKGAVETVLTYGSPIWFSQLYRKEDRRMLNDWQTGVLLKLSRSYKGVSKSIANLLTGVMPIDLTIEEQAILWKVNNIIGYTHTHTAEAIDNLAIIRKCKLHARLPVISHPPSLPAVPQTTRHKPNKRVKCGYSVIHDTFKGQVNHTYIKAIERDGCIQVHDVDLESGEINACYKFNVTSRDKFNGLAAQWIAMEPHLERLRQYQTRNNMNLNVNRMMHVFYLENNSNDDYNKLMADDSENQEVRNTSRLYWAIKSSVRLYEVPDIGLNYEAPLETDYRIIDRVDSYKTKVRSWMTDIWNRRYQRENSTLDRNDEKLYGKHTRRLFRTVHDRLKANWITTGYRMTQILTNHGNLNYMLHKQGLATSPWCDKCTSIGVAKDDDVMHYLFECEYYKNQRVHLARYALKNNCNDLRSILMNREAFCALRAYIHSNDKLDDVRKHKAIMINIAGIDETGDNQCNTDAGGSNGGVNTIEEQSPTHHDAG